MDPKSLKSLRTRLQRDLQLRYALDHAADMLRAVNDSHVASQIAESVRGMAKKYGGYAAVGALPFGGYDLVKHLLGE
jgi:hypothetical protein